MPIMTKRAKKSRNTLESSANDVPVEIPERRLYAKCNSCKRIVDIEEAARDLDVCPHCGHHMRLGARRRLEITCDKDSFQEWFADLEATDFLGFPGYAGKLQTARTKTGEADAVVCGRATIEGMPCAIFVMNGDFMMGSMGAVVGEKISRTFERAAAEELPVVGFTVSGGARMQEGTTSLMQMAKVSAARQRFSTQGGFYLCVLTDPTSGGVTASFAMEGDVILAEPGALVAFAGPRVIEQTIHKKLPEGFQSAEFQLEHGFVDRIVARADIRDELGRLLSLHAPADVAAQWVRPCTRPAQETPARPVKVKGATTMPEVSCAYDRVKNARSAERATALDIIDNLFTDFVELHGDRGFRDDAAVVAGVARLGGRAVTVIATERGRNLKERVARNFGSAHPEGYRKALRLMHQAERFDRPVVCLIDTSGAYCGIEAEERGQGAAIADNLVAMAGLACPVVSVVIGEGGSGGALGLGVADRVWMLENAVYSVISPEGCASILYKDASKAPEAAAALGLTADKLLELGIIDRIVSEGTGSPADVAANLREALVPTLDELAARPTDALLQERYEKFRQMGVATICSR